MKIQLLQKSKVFDKLIPIGTIEKDKKPYSEDIIKASNNTVWIVDTVASYPSGKIEAIVYPYFLFKNERRKNNGYSY